VHEDTNTRPFRPYDIYNLNPLLKGNHPTPLLSERLQHMHSWLSATGMAEGSVRIPEFCSRTFLTQTTSERGSLNS